MSPVNFTDLELSPELCLELAVLTAEDSQVVQDLWYVGVILSVLASVASNLGVNVQKYSMMKEIQRAKENKEYKEKPYIRQQLWLFGLLLVIAGALGDFAALGYAAQSLVTPVGGFTIVANLFFAHFWLEERLDKNDLGATFLVLLGIVLVAVSAEKSTKRYTLDCLVALYKRKEFIIYVVVMLATVGILYFGTTRLAKLKEASPFNPGYHRWKKLHPIFPAALSGFVGAQSVLFAKSVAELLKESFTNGNNQFNSWEVYLIIFCLLTAIFVQLHWLAHGLRLFDAVLIVPIFQCCFITGGVVGGAFYFAEFDDLSDGEIVVFVAGLLLTIIGVYLLTRREHVEDVSWDSVSVPDSSQLGDRDTLRSSASVLRGSQDTRKSSIVGYFRSELNRRMTGQRGTKKGSVVSFRSLSVTSFNEDGVEETVPYVPMSIQHPGLAAQDLIHAANLDKMFSNARRNIGSFSDRISGNLRRRNAIRPQDHAMASRTRQQSKPEDPSEGPSDDPPALQKRYTGKSRDPSPEV
mmetsp:Transcript_7361/g.8449  ORF Transcript_7361/g.8449 Transcript_7361/m.8449 type:complete len:523 (-) Transcript_7361:280-1848(-)